MRKTDGPKGPRRIDITTPGDASSSEPTECPFVPETAEAPPVAVALPEAEVETSDQELARLQEMMTDLERKCAYAEDQHLRLAAELQNYKRRVQQEKEQLVRFATEDLVTELIPVLDNFERALQVKVDSPGAECLAAGVRMICDQLSKVLAAHGVERIEALGETFDPHRHEAVERQEEHALPPDVIVGELAKGYVLNGRVVRPAKVRVTARPKEDEGA